MMRISEKYDVQRPLINSLIGIGWQFIPPGDFKSAGWRGDDETNPFLLGILRQQLAKLNGWHEDDQRIDEVIRQLRLLPANLEGHERFVHWLRGQIPMWDPADKLNRDVKLIDYDELDNNLYHFTEEMPFFDRDRRRMDMVLFVNGLPVLLVENKNPKSQDPGMEGFQQVQGSYTNSIPAFLKYPVPFAVPAARLEYGATWNPSVKAFYRWKAFDGSDAGLEELSKGFLTSAWSCPSFATIRSSTATMTRCRSSCCVPIRSALCRRLSIAFSPGWMIWMPRILAWNGTHKDLARRSP